MKWKLNFFINPQLFRLRYGFIKVRRSGNRIDASWPLTLFTCAKPLAWGDTPKAYLLFLIRPFCSKPKQLLPGELRKRVTQGACPIKLLEYMAAARPLLASNMPIVRELVREDVDALLFSPNDPDDLTRQTLALLTDFDLSKRLSESASARARTKFTWHESQKKLARVYENLLK